MLGLNSISQLPFLAVIWNPNPIAFDFGIFQVSWYGLTWSLSIVVGYLMTRTIFRKENKNLDLAVVYVQYIFLGSMIGARVFDVLYYHFDAFIARPLIIFEVWNGGLASHGAVLGVLFVMYLFSKKDSFTMEWCVDRAALMAPLLGGFIRFGNFINGELYGKASTLPWAVIFPYTDYQLIPRHPVQLYEMLWLFSCSAIFWWIYYNKKTQKWFFTSMFFIVVLGGRFFIEFLKDSDTYFGPFSNTQYLSLVAVIFGLILYKMNFKKMA